MLVLALLQAVSGPVDPGSARPGCAAPARLDEVVVCGRAVESPYRVKPLAGAPAERAPPKAATRLGGGTLSVEAQQGNVGPIPTNRAMITFRLPF